MARFLVASQGFACTFLYPASAQIMDKRFHSKIVRKLARELNLDPFYADVGSQLPDLDLYIGKHRKTLHNPTVIATLGLLPNEQARKSFLFGFASHLIIDAFSKEINAVNKLMKLVEVLQGESQEA